MVYANSYLGARATYCFLCYGIRIINRGLQDHDVVSIAGLRLHYNVATTWNAISQNNVAAQIGSGRGRVQTNV
jgi:hypothetical protein